MKHFFRELASRYLFFWAAWVLHERKPRIVGVTGSVGKTTTKEAIAQTLAHPSAKAIIGSVGKSEGTLNTEFGLPLAVLRYTEAPGHWLGWVGLFLIVPFRALALASVAPYPTVLVLEYAADRPGDIRRLTTLAHPEVAVVTAVGPAHLEKFMSVEAVAQEKGRLVRAAAPTGLVVLARDNSFVAAMEDLTSAKVRKVPGRGAALSVGIAEVVGDYFGLSKKLTDEALEDFHSIEGRLETKKIGSWHVIDDTYNANPLSVELALDTFAQTGPAKARRVAFLGEMRELGVESPRYHREIGEYARGKVDLLYGVGEMARHYQPDEWFATSTAAARELHRLLRSDDLILIKGSRGVRMERVVDGLEELAQKKD